VVRIEAVREEHRKAHPAAGQEGAPAVVRTEARLGVARTAVHQEVAHTAVQLVGVCMAEVVQA
jgi:hypothetical protein